MLPQIPVAKRFPNRYTGGYQSSTVTDKLKWQTIASVKASRISVNTNMGTGPVIAKKAADCCPLPDTLVPTATVGF